MSNSETFGEIRGTSKTIFSGSPHPTRSQSALHPRYTNSNNESAITDVRRFLTPIDPLGNVLQRTRPK